MFAALFGTRRIRIICPHCLRECQLTKTERNCNAPGGCGKEIPEGYRDAYKELPPLFVPVLGWRNAGKTWSLVAMARLLGLAARLWDGFLREPGDEHTLDWERRVVKSATDGMEMIGPTPDEEQPPKIILLRNLPRWRDRSCSGRTLVIRDFAGEMFKGMKISPEAMTFIRQARTVMLMHCLQDLDSVEKNQERFSMDDLLNSYTHSLGAEAKNKRTNLVVVLSKADQLQRSLPQSLSEYLKNDPISRELFASVREPAWDNVRLATYLEEMKRASETIKEFLEDRYPEAQFLIRKAESLKMPVRFCIVSASGGVEITGARTAGTWAPSRILDPLFTALEMEAGHV